MQRSLQRLATVAALVVAAAFATGGFAVLLGTKTN